MNNQDWSHLGDEIKDAVQSAIDSRDFTRLNESIGKTVNEALDRFEQVLDGSNAKSADHSSQGQGIGGIGRDNCETDTGSNDTDGRNWYNNGGSFWYNTGGKKAGNSGRSASRVNTSRINGEAGKQPLRTINPFRVYEDRYAAPVSSQVFGILSSVFGGIMAAGCGIAEFVMLLVGTTIFSGQFPVGMPLAMGIMVPFIVGGGILVNSGRKKLGLVKRYKKYVACLGDKEYCELEDLEYAAAAPRKKLLKDLRKMIDKGWFRQGHLDQQETSLIVTDQAYRQYLEAQKEFKRREREAGKNPGNADTGVKKVAEAAGSEAGKASGNAGTGAALPEEVQEVIEEGRGYLQQIRESNDAIPGEEISRKISRLERVIGRIFNRVEQHPELVEELRRFMKYYLPTTVKLLKAYEELDQQEIQGANIQKSKKEIEDTLDTINKAFENLLDSFFEDAAVDISSDISVMQTLMAQEGLLGGSLKDRVKEKEKVLR